MKISIRKRVVQVLFAVAFLTVMLYVVEENTEKQAVQSEQEIQNIVTTEQEDETAENVNTVEQYYGKWKVVQYIPLNVTKVDLSYWRKEHYLGRTVEITENTYVKSIYYWPGELDAYAVSYDYCKVVDMNRNGDWITRYERSLRWLDGDYFDDSIIRMLLFYQNGEDYPEICCAVSKNNDYLIVSWLSGRYLLERYDEQAHDVTIENIYGDWEITRLDSYDSTYEGNVKDTEFETKEWIEEWTEHLNLSEFYAPDWFDKKVNITTDYLEVESYINGQITKIQSQVVNKEAFEQEQGIHDGLSLDNEELVVYQIYYGDADNVLTVVPVNKNKIIIHIEMGWFVLEK